MKWFGLMVMVCTVLCMSGVASADYTAADLTRAVSVADTYWPDSPCKGQEVVEEVSLTDMPWLANIGGALKWEGECIVEIVKENIPDALTLCGILVHEFGHAAGMVHSTDPTNVMYPTLVIAPECYPPADAAVVSTGAVVGVRRGHGRVWRWRHVVRWLQKNRSW